MAQQLKYIQPAYYFANQKVYAFGNQLFMDYEELSVVAGGHASAHSIRVKDINGIEYDCAPTYLFTSAQTYHQTYTPPAQTVKPKQLAKAFTEFTEEQKYLIDLIALSNHKDVIAKTCEGIDMEQYHVFEGPMWFMAVPKELTGTAPVLMAHTDTVLANPQSDVLEYDPTTKKFFSARGLGADDRAGCWAINQTVKANPGKYIFLLFDLEEKGCQGSNQFTNSQQFLALDKIATCYISIDRKRGADGAHELATYDYDNAELFKLIGDATGRKTVRGSVTDCKTLSAKSYTVADGSKLACCNFSCGYLSEHSVNEVLYYEELQKVVEDLTKLANLTPKLWEQKWVATKATYGNSYYQGSTYKAPGKAKKGQAKNLWDDEDFILYDGELFDGNDLAALIYFYKQSTGRDYMFKECQLLLKEFKVSNYVRLDTSNPVGCNNLDRASANSLSLRNWVVSKVNEDNFTLELKAADNNKIMAENIPFSWMKSITKSDPYVD